MDGTGPGGLSPLPVERLRRRYRVEGFATTADLPEEPVGIIGQERAVQAMDFGLRAAASGYHIYVAGPVGTGRSTYVAERLRRQAAGRPTPPDTCYVFDFAVPERPRLLVLPAGNGRRLQRDMRSLLAELRADLRRVFEGKEYEEHAAEVGRSQQARAENLTEELQAAARAAGFAIRFTSTGLATAPLGPGGQPLTQEAFDALPDADRQRLQAAGQALEEAAAETARSLRQIERDTRARLRQLDRETAQVIMDPVIRRLKEAYPGQPAVADYLDAVANDAVEHLDLFRADGGEPAPTPPTAAGAEFWHRYHVNVFVEHAPDSGAPVVVADSVHLGELVGYLEFRGGPAGPATDFALVRPGALQRASGGYLVLPLRELLGSPGAYEALKRSLRRRQVRVAQGPAAAAPFALVALDPEPMALDVTVVLIGPAGAYPSLLLADDDFRKLFKVKVEFDEDMPAEPDNVARYTAFIASVCRREGVPHLSAGAVAAVLEYSGRLAGDQGKLSTRFNEIVDLIVGAGIWASAEGRTTTGAADVARALRERARRAGRIEDRLIEATRNGSLRVQTRGAVVGQVNGLTVLNLGDHAFGRPVRITARAWLGRRGVVHIERESRMSGHLHTKGVLTLAAYLAATYAQRQPLALSASLAFEQMYEEVDGDSASSAELYALLSELAGLPVRQGVAVTGSVDQRGEIQPIGGVNEKVEGFFRACAAGGPDGEQGVLVPAANVRELALDDEVLEAVAAGRFHIWAAETVDQGIELLTGTPAGSPGPDGAFAPESVHGRVAARLQDYAEHIGRLGPAER